MVALYASALHSAGVQTGDRIAGEQLLHAFMLLGNVHSDDHLFCLTSNLDQFNRGCGSASRCREHWGHLLLDRPRYGTRGHHRPILADTAEAHICRYRGAIRREAASAEEEARYSYLQAA